MDSISQNSWVSGDSCILIKPSVPNSFFYFSQAVLVNSTLYISGQLGLDAETMNFVSDEVTGQATQALTNMSHILEAAGTSFDKGNTLQDVSERMVSSILIKGLART